MKIRHNLVWVLVDISCKAGVLVRKKEPMGFSSVAGKDLRSADLLLFDWLHGKDACVNVTGGSPFAGMRVSSCAPGASLANATEKRGRNTLLTVRRMTINSPPLFSLLSMS